MKPYENNDNLRERICAKIAVLPNAALAEAEEMLEELRVHYLKIEAAVEATSTASPKKPRRALAEIRKYDKT